MTTGSDYRRPMTLPLPGDLLLNGSNAPSYGPTTQRTQNEMLSRYPSLSLDNAHP